jgi:hypothetical protein
MNIFTLGGCKKAAKVLREAFHLAIEDQEQSEALRELRYVVRDAHEMKLARECARMIHLRTECGMAKAIEKTRRLVLMGISPYQLSELAENIWESDEVRG